LTIRIATPGIAAPEASDTRPVNVLLPTCP